MEAIFCYLFGICIIGLASAHHMNYDVKERSSKLGKNSGKKTTLMQLETFEPQKTREKQDQSEQRFYSDPNSQNNQNNQNNNYQDYNDYNSNNQVTEMAGDQNQGTHSVQERSQSGKFLLLKGEIHGDDNDDSDLSILEKLLPTKEKIIQSYPVFPPGFNMGNSAEQQEEEEEEEESANADYYPQNMMGNNRGPNMASLMGQMRPFMMPFMMGPAQPMNGGSFMNGGSSMNSGSPMNGDSFMNGGSPMNGGSFMNGGSSMNSGSSMNGGTFMNGGSNMNSGSPMNGGGSPMNFGSSSMNEGFSMNGGSPMMGSEERVGSPIVVEEENLGTPMMGRPMESRPDMELAIPQMQNNLPKINSIIVEDQSNENQGNQVGPPPQWFNNPEGSTATNMVMETPQQIQNEMIIEQEISNQQMQSQPQSNSFMTNQRPMIVETIPTQSMRIQQGPNMEYQGQNMMRGPQEMEYSTSSGQNRNQFGNQENMGKENEPVFQNQNGRLPGNSMQQQEMEEMVYQQNSKNMPESSSNHGSHSEEQDKMMMGQNNGFFQEGEMRNQNFQGSRPSFMVEFAPQPEPAGCHCGPKHMKTSWPREKSCVKRCALHQMMNQATKRMSGEEIE